MRESNEVGIIKNIPVQKEKIEQLKDYSDAHGVEDCFVSSANLGNCIHLVKENVYLSSHVVNDFFKAIKENSFVRMFPCSSNMNTLNAPLFNVKVSKESFNELKKFSDGVGFNECYFYYFKLVNQLSLMELTQKEELEGVLDRIKGSVKSITGAYVRFST